MNTSIFFGYFLVFCLIGFSVLIKQQKTKFTILGISYLLAAYSSLIIYLLKSHLILSVPSLYRTESPLKYLYGPFSYFFILYTLNGNRKWSKKDLLHLIPFLLSIVSLIPTFLLPDETKINLLNSLTVKNYLTFLDGFLPLKITGILKHILFLIYSFFCIKLLLPFFKNQNSNLFIKNKQLLTWLLFDIVIKIIIFTATLVFVFISNNEDSSYRDLTLLLFQIEMMIGSVYLFLNPKLLVGIRWANISEDNDNPVNDKTLTNREKKEQLILTELQQFMKIDEPYRKKIEINEIAKALNVSPIKLASLIKEKHNQSFTDYINTYRLNYVDFQVSKKEHLKYSFEHIAYDAGFNSKNTFYISFKKLRNTTPKKYYETIIGDEKTD